MRVRLTLSRHVARLHLSLARAPTRLTGGTAANRPNKQAWPARSLLLPGRCRVSKRSPDGPSCHCSWPAEAESKRSRHTPTMRVRRRVMRVRRRVMRVMRAPPVCATRPTGLSTKDSYEVLARGGTLQCLAGTVLDLGAAQVPDCFVVLARFPRDGGSPGDLAACERCSEPGLSPFVPSVPLEDIGQGLSDYRCLCTVRATAMGAPCPSPDPSTNSWCYSPDPAPMCAGSGFIAFSSPTAGTLFLACYAPGSH